MESFEGADLRAILQVLPKRHRIAFIASCAERVLPFYEAFARQDEVQGYDDLRHALDVAWSAVIGVEIPGSEYAKIENRLVSAAPDPERTYRSPCVPNAFDVIDIMQNAYDVLKSDDDEELGLLRAVESGLLARTTIDLYLGLVTIPEFAPLTLARSGNPVMYTTMAMFMAEVQKQMDDLLLLKRVSNLDDEVVLVLRRRGFAGVQPVTRLAL